MDINSNKGEDIFAVRNHSLWIWIARTDKLKFGSSGAWWSEKVCDPDSEFSDRVRVKIGVGLGQGLANQEPYLGPCSQWEEKGISLTPGERILVQSRHGWVESERTVMRTLVIHSDVLGPLLGLCHCHSPRSSRGQHHDKMTLRHPDHHLIIKHGWRFSEIWKQNKKNITVLEAAEAKRPASQPRPMSSCE